MEELGPAESDQEVHSNDPWGLLTLQQLRGYVIVKGALILEYRCNWRKEMEYPALMVWAEELMQQVVVVPNAHVVLVRVETGVLLNTRAVAAVAVLSTGVVWGVLVVLVSIGVLLGVVGGYK